MADSSTGWHWRNTMKSARFFRIDARAGFFVGAGLGAFSQVDDPAGHCGHSNFRIVRTSRPDISIGSPCLSQVDYRTIQTRGCLYIPTQIQRYGFDLKG